jgi:hypothetical protein
MRLIGEISKSLRKPKGLSRLDNPETLATFGIEPKQTTTKTHTKQETKKISNTVTILIYCISC